MKYILILGYQLFEKNNTVPIIKVSLNDTLMEEFRCDNTASTEVTFKTKIIVDVTGEGGFKHKDTKSVYSQFQSPSKYKIYELDDENWPGENKLKIEVNDNKSNYTNGFMNKKSLVSFNPIFLIRKDILLDKEKMFRLMKYEYWAEMMYPMKKAKQRWKWPGLSSYEHRGQDIRESHEELCKGGENFTLEFPIIKKYNMRVLCGVGSKPKGIFYIDNFFKAWYDSYLKQIHVQQTDLKVNRKDIMVNDKVDAMNVKSNSKHFKINVDVYPDSANK